MISQLQMSDPPTATFSPDYILQSLDKDEVDSCLNRLLQQFQLVSDRGTSSSIKRAQSTSRTSLNHEKVNNIMNPMKKFNLSHQK